MLAQVRSRCPSSRIKRLYFFGPWFVWFTSECLGSYGGGAF